MRANPINTHGFISWKEWFYIKLSYWKWFFRTFLNKSKFQGFDVTGEIKLKPKKKGLVISGNTVRNGGQIVVE